MADLLNVKLSGDAFEGLARLTEALGENALRATGYAGAKVFQEEAIANTAKFKEPTGVIRDNIIVKRIEEESDGAKKQTYRVVVRKGKMNVKGDAYYAGWVESGHKIVRRKPKNKAWKAHREAEAVEFGSSTVPAKPFMRPAYTNKVKVALDAMRAKLAEKLKESAL
jgi:HK97 gp10 family phage protein